jgi:hypothetical protein
MTRQIEFRAWDGLKMIYPDSDGWFNYCKLADYNILQSIRLDTVIKKLKAMQWTGLLDKNGKKIFEGDIVRIWDNPENYVEAVEWDEFSARFILSDGHGLRDFEFIEIEVLGNIFENPELLTQK